jgi:hypothetical protein
VNPERAETYLRQRAEAELRRATAQAADTMLRGGFAARLARIARALTAVGALRHEVAELILDDYELALGIRTIDASGQHGPAHPPASAVARARAAMLLRSPQWKAQARAAVAMAGAAAGQPPASAAPERAAPVGQLMPVGDNGELYLLSYLQTASGAMFAMFARAFGSSGSPAFHQLTATDDRGTRYTLNFAGGGGGPGEWWTGVLGLHPRPPHDPRWLDVVTAPGAAAVRVDLSRPPDVAEMTIDPADHNPSEHLLYGVATRLLAAAPLFPRDMRVRPAAPGRLIGLVDGLGEIIAALQEAGALSQLSPVPGQLATLCVSLDVAGHGIAARPAARIPEPWLSMLAHYHRRKPRDRAPAPEREGWVGLATTLPELDGISLAILGLHNTEDGTVMHVHATGMLPPAPGWAHEFDVSPVIWIRDSEGRWHVTRVSGWGAWGDGEASLRLEVVPPLSRSAAWIEVRVSGRSAEARVILPLRWA